MPSFWRTQKPCLEHAEKNCDDIVFSTFIHGIRMYSSVSNKDEYARFLLSDVEGANTCCELLWKASSTYLDLDSSQTLEKLGFTCETEFVTQFNEMLVWAFGKYLDTVITPSNMLWSCSTREKKTSYHIKVVCLDKFWPAETRKSDKKNFMKLLESECMNRTGFHWLVSENNEIRMYSVLDTSVYSRNRTMRSLTQKKPEHDQCFELLSKHGATHSDIVAHLLTVTPAERQNRTAFIYKSTQKFPTRTQGIHENIFKRLANNYGAEFVKVEGSLVILKNRGCRHCPIGKEENTSDNCFFLLRDHGQSVYFGCHNSDCSGKLLLAHSFLSTKEYQHYEDYKKLLLKPEVSTKDIRSYLCSVISYVDKVTEPYFVTTSKVPLELYDHRLYTNQVSCSKQLFRGYQDIQLAVTDSENPATFSGILGDLMKQRGIKTYSQACWMPFTQADVPVLPETTLNMFQGFALENIEVAEKINFRETSMFDLIVRLTGHRQDSLDYFLSFISEKLCRPRVKHPIALCFLGSREGNGKGTLGTWLTKVFGCSENTFVSFNSLETFKNSFNGIQSRALFLCLEEVTAKRGGLHEYNGFLKDKISSTTLCCELKGKERILVPWYANLLLFSNEYNVLTVSKWDRRLVFFESDSSIANDTAYFRKIHQELDSIPHLKAAYDFLLNYDSSSWNYRLIPETQTKQNLVRCSEKTANKFHMHLFRYMLKEQQTYTLTEEDLYMYYCEFAMNFGIQNKRDRYHVCTQFELFVKPKKEGLLYNIPRDNITDFLG